MQSIQSLVGSIRADDNPLTVKDHIDGIASILSKVVSETQQTLSNTNNRTLRSQAKPTVETLAESRSRLLDASVEVDRINDAIAWKENTKMLPPLAFKVARETKELVQKLDQVEGGEEDDFR